jgi:anti-anti-sigma factor
MEAQRIGPNVVVSVTGELDVFNAAGMAAEIEAAIPSDAHGAVLDLSAVGFLDSTAIRKLFGLTARLRERRQRVLVVTPGGSIVLRTLELVEFARAAPLHESLEAALAELAAGGDSAA